MQDWKKEIAVMVYVKQALAEVDKAQLWPHHFPSVAASDEQIAEAEHHLGFAIDECYAEFLRHANGWRGFYQTVDLFGTRDLLDSDLMNYARSLLNSIDPEVLKQSRIARATLLPIAATRLDRDLFLIDTPASERPGRVTWFAGTEIQRFDNFDEYFLAMVDYNRRRVEKTREKYTRST